MLSLSHSRINRPLLVAATLLAATGLLTLSARVSLPFWPVPLTLQGAAVVILGATLGPRLGAAAVGLYLVEGALGLPVFAGTPARGAGLAYLAGPTGGFLAGFVLSAFLAGRLAARGWMQAVPGALLACGLSLSAMYLPGLLWLGQFTGYGSGLLAAGMLPFLAGDALKIALAALVLRQVSHLSQR